MSVEIKKVLIQYWITKTGIIRFVNFKCLTCTNLVWLKPKNFCWICKSCTRPESTSTFCDTQQWKQQRRLMLMRRNEKLLLTTIPAPAPHLNWFQLQLNGEWSQVKIETHSSWSWAVKFFQQSLIIEMILMWRSELLSILD